MKIYFVRHGETLWNTERKMQGQSDIPLNEFGCTLATKTGIGMKNISFDTVYASPLVRAYHTAELIMKENDYNSKQEIIADDRIKEIGFGIYEGLCCGAEGWNMPDDNFKYFFKNCDQYKTPEGGESFEDIMLRVSEFIEELFANEAMQDKTILIVSHGAAIRGILNYFRKIPNASYWDGGVHKNCGVTIVNYNDGEIDIEIENMVYYDDVAVDWYGNS